MAAETIPAVTLAAPTSFPTAGVGGAYYDTAFGVPTYPSAMNDLVTWRMLDSWDHITINYALTQGISLGLVWATLVYLLALTPNHKRTTLFHSFLLVGLLFMLIHLMIDAISSVVPGLQPTSAYVFVTGDIMSSTWTKAYSATFGASEVTGRIAFIFAAICLWLQAKGLMTGIRVRFPNTYRFILTYLAVTALAALATGMTYSIQQIVLIGKAMTPAQYNGSSQMRIAELAAYTVSIGSFSLVSIVSVVDIIWQRPSSVLKGHNAYASALNLVALLGVQSFIIPFIFCILQIIPNPIAVVHPEIMLLPTVYMILPLGSLFVTVNSSDQESPQASFPPKEAPGRTAPIEEYLDRSPTLTGGTLPSSRPSSYTLDVQGQKPLVSQIDRELNVIDSLDRVLGDASETDAMLKSEAEKTKNGSEPVHSEKSTV